MVAFDLAQYQQLFKQMGYADDYGAALLLRTQLLKAIKAEIQKKNWTQQEAAQKLGVTQPRISEIYSLKIDKFTVELLVKFLFRLGREVIFDIQSARSWAPIKQETSPASAASVETNYGSRYSVVFQVFGKFPEMQTE